MSRYVLCCTKMNQDGEWLPSCKDKTEIYSHEEQTNEVWQWTQLTLHIRHNSAQVEMQPSWPIQGLNPNTMTMVNHSPIELKWSRQCIPWSQAMSKLASHLTMAKL
ncbi:unnamed protein product [Lathyrus oleraceus]